MAHKKKFISQEYSTHAKGKNLQEGTPGSRALTIFATSFFSFAIIIGVSMIAFTIVFMWSEVQGTSMMMTLNASYYQNGSWVSVEMDTDAVLMNRFKDPERGDIIILEHYKADGTYDTLHIKRIIAFGGESVYFRLVDKDGNPAENLNTGVRYVIEVIDKDGNILEVDNLGLYHLDPYFGQNNCNTKYDRFWQFQQGLPITMHDSFRSHYEKDGESIPFRQYSEARARYEIKLPEDYFFYLGDNRGGSGVGRDDALMSADAAYYGPQPTWHIKGTVTEIIYNRNALEWFGDKLAWFFTFQWI